MSDDRQPAETDTAANVLTVLCEECGELIVVKDPAALVRSLHLSNACAPMQQVLGEPST